LVEKKKKKKITDAKKVEKIDPKAPPIPPPQPPQQVQQKQPAAADIIKSMRNEITLATEDSKDRILQVFNNLIQQIASASSSINQLTAENKRLLALCSTQKINPNPPKPKAPNRQQRRAAERKAKKKTTR